MVGVNSTINNNVLIEHDSRIGDHCHISTGAIVNGDCTIGDQCFVGSGAIINHGINIVGGCVIGSGSVVVKDITQSGTYVGVPARASRMKKSFVIIAEAGVNHNGNLQMAKELVQMAAKCGADYVKFQTFKADRLVTESAPKADYQIQNQDKEQGSQIDMLKRLELSNTDHVELLAECERHSIKFLSTGFDVESIEYLIDLGIELIKIPSGEVTNFPLLSYVGSKNMPTVLSTGMSTLQEVKQAAKVLFDHGLDKAKLTVLHCNTEYPTPMDDVNLRAMANDQK
jgi:sialic acid synthase SpsE